MNNLDKNYQNILNEIISNGSLKKDENGTGALSIFGKQILHHMSEGFPLLTTKEISFKDVVTELIWFLRGDTNVKFLLENNCGTWNDYLYKNYLNLFDNRVRVIKEVEEVKLSKEEFLIKLLNNNKFLSEFGDLGPIYGKQWRKSNFIRKEFKTNETGSFIEQYREIEIDQIKKILIQLEENPDNRKMIVNSWNLSEIDYMNFSPYHYSFQIYTQRISLKKRIENWTKSSNIDEIILEEFNKKSEEEKHIYLDEYSNVNSREISLLVNQRSINVFSELPFNLALYGLLLNIIAQIVDMVPDKIILNIGEIYLDINDIEQAKEQISRQPYHLCKLKINDKNWKTFTEKDNNFDEFINSIQINDFSIDSYVHHQVLV